MDNLRLTVFDIFSYTVPGLCYLILISLGLGKTNTSELVNIISGLSIYSFFAYCFIAYLLGFTLDTVAGGITVKIIEVIRGKLKERVLSNFLRENPDSKITEYHFSKIYSFADIKEEKSREKADQYSAMSGLARNLSLAFLIYALITFCHALVYSEDHQWKVFLFKFVVGITVSAILMWKSDTFRQWSHGHLLTIYHYYNCESDKNITDTTSD